MNVTLLGGGFGRKSKADFVTEAALLSREVGAPVRVQWTREDDVRHSFYHTTSAERIEVALDDEGKVTGWLHRSVAPSILSTFAPDEGNVLPLEQGMGLSDVPFDIPNIRCESGKALAHTRIGWFRAVSNLPHAWAIGSFVGDLAHELGKDQKTMWLELIGAPRTLDPAAAGLPDTFWNYGEPMEEFPIETGRLAHVLNVAADGIGYGKDLPEGEGIGLAVHRSFVSYVACAAHVKVVDGRITVPEIHMAIDCGFCANPERVESQMQGAAVMGMSVALHSGITYRERRRGRVELLRLRRGALGQLSDGRDAYRAASVQRACDRRRRARTAARGACHRERPVRGNGRAAAIAPHGHDRLSPGARAAFSAWAPRPAG